jgi:hypothetical protein
MQTFDVSVNLLTDKVFSDKIIFNQNGENRANYPPPVQKQPAQKQQTQRPPHSETPVSVALPSCSRAAQVPVDIAILLLLPGTFMFVFVLMITYPKGDNSARDRISTLVACAVLLSTPAVLTVWNPRTSGRRPLLVHMLLLHATALLAVLRPENIYGVSVVWAAVFAHLGFQLPARRWACFLLMALNVANVALLLSTQEKDKVPDTWGHLSALLFNAGVVLASAAGYAYCYIILC